jgi:hypothetical protein
MRVVASTYQWWFFAHILGVFAFLLSHGVSAGVALRLRKERDPARIDALLQLSSWSITWLWPSIGILLLGGVVAGFLGHWWSFAWIWASLGILVFLIVEMLVVASPYYRRVRTIVTAMAGGSEAVTAEQLDQVLRSIPALFNSVLGFSAIVGILYLMIFKPF